MLARRPHLPRLLLPGITDEGEETNDGDAEGRLPRFVAKWQAEFGRTAEALLYRADRNELSLGHDDEVSLLLTLQSAVWVASCPVADTRMGEVEI